MKESKYEWPAAQKWFERPVFISGTFNDLQMERDHLRDVVFPELEHRLLKLRGIITAVDLRWGVETTRFKDDDAKNVHILKVCLDEIDRSRPFMLILLGDQYGWIPPAAAVAEVMPDAVTENRSITHLEVQYGLLRHPANDSYGLCYIRSGAGRSAAADKRLDQLKSEIQTHSPLSVRTYHIGTNSAEEQRADLFDWGQGVIADLWHLLTGYYGHGTSAEKKTWQLGEREEIEKFVIRNTRYFNGWSGLLKQMMSFISGDFGKQTAVITGGPGAGKTALFSAFYRLLEKQEITVLAHLPDVNTDGRLIERMIRRWAYELGSIVLDDGATADEISYEEAFQLFYRRLALVALQRTVVILVDALEQFEPSDNARFVAWLRPDLPERVYFIGFSIDGHESRAIGLSSDSMVYQLPSLTLMEAVGIVRSCCGLAHKSLSLLAVETLALAGGGNPLWIKLAVDRLILLDKEDFGQRGRFPGSEEQRLENLIMHYIASFPVDIGELHQFLYDTYAKKMARDFGIGWVSDMLGMLGISRSGLRQRDLQRLLMPQDPDGFDRDFALVRRFFSPHFSQAVDDPFFRLGHEQAKTAALDICLLGGRSLGGLLERLEFYVSSLPAGDHFRTTELMHYYLGSGEYAKVVDHYSAELTPEELKYASLALADLFTGLKNADDFLEILFRTMEELRYSLERCIIFTNRFTLHTDYLLEPRLPVLVRARLYEVVKEGLRRWEDMADRRYIEIIMRTFYQLALTGSKANHHELALYHYKQCFRLIRQTPEYLLPKGWPRQYAACLCECGDILFEQGHTGEAHQLYTDSWNMITEYYGKDYGNEEFLELLGGTLERIASL